MSLELCRQAELLCLLIEVGLCLRFLFGFGNDVVCLIMQMAVCAEESLRGGKQWCNEVIMLVKLLNADSTPA